MDYYRRKLRSMNLIKKLLKEDNDVKTIAFAVEDKYQMSPNWTKKYIDRLNNVEEDE